MSNKKDILDKMLDKIDNENLFAGVQKVDLEDLYSKSVKFLKSKVKK